jgi:hypothetical protein
MGWKTIVPIAAALACYAPALAIAQEKPSNDASAITAQGLTREQFQALPPNALIEINGEHITKSEFQGRTIEGLQKPAKQLQDIRARGLTAFEARRNAVMGKREATLAEANKKVEAEIAKLVAVDAAEHGAKWDPDTA